MRDAVIIKLKNILCRWRYNIEEICLYSDTYLLEIAVSAAVLVINPIFMHAVHGLPLIWISLAYIGSGLLGYGILERNLAIRYWGIRMLWVYLLVLVIQCIIGTFVIENIIGYSMQLVIVWFLLWKNKKQLTYYSTKKA
jgi:hypothetical protein